MRLKISWAFLLAALACSLAVHAQSTALPEFAAARTFVKRTGPASFVSADFNGDGRPDLAVANFAADLSLFFGRADGTFTRPSSVSMGGSGASSVAIVFLNTTTNSRPRLVAEFRARTIALSWSTEFAGAVLESTSDPEKGPWLSVTTPAREQSGRFVIELPISTGAAYFRLHLE